MWWKASWSESVSLDSMPSAARLRQAFDGQDGQRRYVAGGGMTVEDAKAAYASGRCDAVMFGRLLIANPDLGRRIREDLPLAEPDESTFYGGGSEGYTDYPGTQTRNIERCPLTSTSALRMMAPKERSSKLCSP